jgi:hypothetical protein
MINFPGGLCWGESSVRRVGIFRVQWFRMGQVPPAVENRVVTTLCQGVAFFFSFFFWHTESFPPRRILFRDTKHYGIGYRIWGLIQKKRKIIHIYARGAG